MLLTKRILTNLRAILELAIVSYNNDGNHLFKLPVGILLRNSITDCIIGLYFKKQDDVALRQILEKLNHDYVNALFEEFEVYRDKISFSKYDDEFAEHIYTLSLEDTFFHYLEFNEKRKDSGTFKERSEWKVKSQKKYLPKSVEGKTHLKNMHQILSKDSQLSSCANSLYAYYKYFSQWEHFSERGAGDVFAKFGEDNIKILMIFGHINTALDFILN